jgi:hypothetical protein
MSSASENIQWNQWIAGVRAEMISALWASADVRAEADEEL